MTQSAIADLLSTSYAFRKPGRRIKKAQGAAKQAGFIASITKEAMTADSLAGQAVNYHPFVNPEAALGLTGGRRALTMQVFTG